MKKLFCRQPKLLICIELKLAEILGVCGIVGIICGIEAILVYLKVFHNVDKFNDWVGCWFLTLIVMGFTFAIGCGIYHAIKANWAWAERLKNKHKYP